MKNISEWIFESLEKNKDNYNSINKIILYTNNTIIINTNNKTIELKIKNLTR